MIRIFSQYVSPKGFLLMAVETALIALSLLFGAKLRFLNDPSELSQFTQLPDFALQTLVFVLMFQTCFYYCDLYNLLALGNRSQQLVSLLQSVGAGSLLLGLVYYIFPQLLIGRGVLFISTILMATLVMGSRVVLEKAWRVAGRHEKTLILGSGELALRVAREITRRNDLTVEISGFVDVDRKGPQQVLDYPKLGSVHELTAVVTQQNINKILVALEDCRGHLPVGTLMRLRVQGLRIEDAHSTIAALTGRIPLDTLRPSWFVFSDGFHRSKLTLILKRSLDLSLSMTGFVLSLPIMMVLAILIRLDSKGPVVYRQMRVGLGGRHFALLKFRSMRVDAEASSGVQWAIEKDPRVTRIGRFMRQYRLDELPQFINVIRGEMSFVGPRPERPFFVDQLREVVSYYDERHTVRPGITGWAQVQYRYGSSVEDAKRKLEYDLFYLKSMSIWFDFAIVFKTVRIVLEGFGGR